MGVGCCLSETMNRKQKCKSVSLGTWGDWERVPGQKLGFRPQCCVLLSTASVTHPTFASHVNFQHEDTGAEKSPEHEAGKRGCKVKAKAGSLWRNGEKWEKDSGLWWQGQNIIVKSWKHTASNDHMSHPTHCPCKLLRYMEAIRGKTWLDEC